MAPKREQVPAATLASIFIGLSSTEPHHQLQALTQLAAATAFSQAEVLQCGIPAKLVSILQQPDKPARLLACRQLASYAATVGPLQQAVTSMEAVEALWAVLLAYHAAEAAITTALMDPAAAKAVQPKKQPATKEIVDPDEWLPGPSKYLLDAALRTLCTLSNSTADFQLHQQDEAAGDVAQSAAGDGGYDLRAVMQAKDVDVLVCLVRHPSGRVQMRACRLAHQLASHAAWADAFAAAGGAAAALNLGVTGTASNPAVQLTALRLLQCLADSSNAAAAVMVAEPQQVAHALMLQILEAGAAPAVHGKNKGPANTVEAGKPVNSEVTPVQLAVADLLACLCSKSSIMSQSVVQSGGLAALQALLPESPASPLTADELAEKFRLSSSGGDTDGTKSPRKSTNSKQPTPRGIADIALQTPPRTPVTPAAEAKQGTPRGATPAASTTAPQTTHTSDGAAGQEIASAKMIPPAEIPMPVVKITAPELQARVLQIVAAILKQQGMVDSLLLLQPSAGRASLLRMLLHMFAPAPVEQPTAVTIDVEQPTCPCDATVLAAARTAAPSKGSSATGAKEGVPAAGARRSGVVAADTAVAGGTTPRKSAASTAAGTAAKEAQTVPDPPAVIDLLAPPYAAITKTAALNCLGHLAQNKQAVMLLAAQQVPIQHGHHQPLLAGQSTMATGAAATQHTWQDEPGVFMLQHLLEDLLLMGGPMDLTSAPIEGSTKSVTMAAAPGQTASTVAAAAALKVVKAPRAIQSQPGSMLDGAAAVLAGLAEHLEQQQLLELPLLPALKAAARCGLSQHLSLHAHQAVARALLLLPEEAYIPAARPPLPSPPPTPPAPPLPTSQFAWDALDRPLITDGAVILSSA